jgi:hypothetical protein
MESPEKWGKALPSVPPADCRWWGCADYPRIDKNLGAVAAAL